MEALVNTFEKKTRTGSQDLSTLHFHNGYEFIFVTNGSVLIEIDHVPHHVKAPAIILLNPFEQHKITGKSNDYERIILVLNSDVLEQNISPRLTAMLKCRPQNFSHTVKPSEDDFARIGTILDSIFAEINNEYLFGERYVLNCIYNFLIIMYRAQGSITNIPSNMLSVQTYIDENYAKIESISQIAQKFCISLPHLSRTFKAYSGYSPVEYLKNTRLYHASRLLIYSDRRINEISAMVGFRETNNFIKQFKSKFNISPYQFRNSNVKPPDSQIDE